MKEWLFPFGTSGHRLKALCLLLSTPWTAMLGAQGLEEANVWLLLLGLGLWVAQSPAGLPTPHHHIVLECRVRAAHRVRVQGEVGGALGVGVKSQIIWPVTKTFGYLLLKNDSWILFFKYLKFSVWVKYRFLDTFYPSSTELGPGATNTKLPETAAFHN